MRKRYKGLSYGMPLALSEEHIAAVLLGTKRHTVRCFSDKERKAMAGDLDGLPAFFATKNKLSKISPPYGEVGDYLWVRESYKVQNDSVVYRMMEDPDKKTPNEEWMPVVGMPEEASRLCLLITGYRYLNGIQEISVADVERDGFKSDFPPGKRYDADIRNTFARYWNTRYRASKDKWEANPPAWIAEFVPLSAEESAALKKAKDYLR